ncbi:MAG: FAD-dependent oxidoreductase [Pontiellaceae bacterium]|jgi:hypothetical protein|nr:FAD-dependent oxidoreductase [Pontiellaceae bacterium]
MNYDVMIAGAGAGGVPAAVAAARRGAKTLLLETGAAPGGTMTAGLGFPVCGLFENEVSRPPRLLNGGLSEEFFNAVCEADRDPVVTMGRVYVCRCSAALFRSIFERWLDHKNLTFIPRITGLEAETSGGKIGPLRFRTSDGVQQTVFPKQVIDCTGQGAVIRQSGAARIEPAKLPLAGFAVRLCGIGPDLLLSVKVPYQLRKAVEAGALPDWCRFTFFSPGHPDGREAVCKFSPPAAFTTDETFAVVQRALAVLRAEIPAFQTLEIIECSPAVLQREGVRLKGRYVLTGDDVRAARTFGDAAARGAWPMEYWDAGNGPQYTFVETGPFYEIPLRALRSETFQNLWAAGRALSADSAALSSVRVIGTAMAAGEACGRAAVENVI